jgi:hypothetical protein
VTGKVVGKWLESGWKVVGKWLESGWKAITKLTRSEGEVKAK